MVRAGLVGLIANPSAGKDLRRLVSGATTVGSSTKVGMVRRAAIGAVAAGALGIVAMADTEGIAERALQGTAVPVEWLGSRAGNRSDTANATLAMAKAGCRALLVFGGDGTNRIVASVWPDAPIVPLSTGTNNVFPITTEATVAGAAAGLVASGAVRLDEVGCQAKALRVEGVHGPDVALVDASLVEGAFVGAGAVWDGTLVRVVIAAFADPHAVGLSAIPGLLMPCGRTEAGGVVVRLDPLGTTRLRAPLVPGVFADLGIVDVRRLPEGEAVPVAGPGVLALDGEREDVLRQGEVIRVKVQRDGPWVLDVAAALRLAAERGVFVSSSGRGVSRAG